MSDALHFAPPRHVAPFTCCSSTNVGLVANLAAHEVFTHPAVSAAMLAVDRASFVQPHLAVFAYGDTPQPLADGVSISAPHLHAATLQALIRPLTCPGGCRALDLGCGSGYLAAAMAHIVHMSMTETADGVVSDGRRTSAQVWASDYSPAVVRQAQLNCAAARPDLVTGGWLHFASGGDGCGGGGGSGGGGDGGPYSEDQGGGELAAAAEAGEGTGEAAPGEAEQNAMHAEFDAIAVGFEVQDRRGIDGLVRRLRPGGQLVAGFDGRLVRVGRRGGGGGRQGEEKGEVDGGTSSIEPVVLCAKDDWVMTELYDGASLSPDRMLQ